MDQYIEANRRHWDEIVPIHVSSDFYDVEGFKRDPDARARGPQLEELGDVRGKSMLHLQCHFGIDSIGLSRRGARVTGVDFSPNAIAAARQLAGDMGADVRFVESNVYDLPDVLDEQFDIVYTSYGVLGWLPDLRRWAQVAARFVRPGGIFYIVEFHPFAWVFDDRPDVDDLHVRYHYFADLGPIAMEEDGTYADRTAPVENRLTYNFPYELGAVVTSLVEAGLRIEFLHEFPYTMFQFVPFMRETDDRTLRLTKHDGCVPLLFSIRATKPA
jgi:ubiquinone/menaquinone biosynthesis C-methylase UbiE